MTNKITCTYRRRKSKTCAETNPQNPDRFQKPRDKNGNKQKGFYKACFSCRQKVTPELKDPALEMDKIEEYDGRFDALKWIIPMIKKDLAEWEKRA